MWFNINPQHHESSAKWQIMDLQYFSTLVKVLHKWLQFDEMQNMLAKYVMCVILNIFWSWSQLCDFSVIIHFICTRELLWSCLSNSQLEIKKKKKAKPIIFLGLCQPSFQKCLCLLVYVTSNILIDYLHLVWAYFWPKSNIHLCLSSDDLDTNVDPMLPRLSKFYHMKSVHMFLSLTMSVFDISHQNSLSEEFLIARSLRNF